MREDLDDVEHLLRWLAYWVGLILETWHGVALFLALVWITVLGLLGQEKLNWVAMGVIWTVVAGVVRWATRRARRDRDEQLVQLNAAVPERFKFTSVGIRWTEPDGRAVAFYWGDVAAWRERERAVAVDRRDGTPAVIVSVGNLPHEERQRLRDFLRSQISPLRPPS